MEKRKVVPWEQIEQSEWFKTRPKSVQQAVKTWPPGWYKIKSTGQEVQLYSYEENEGKCCTCKVIVEKGHNLGALVFGIPLTDLERLVVPKGA